MRETSGPYIKEQKKKENQKERKMCRRRMNRSIVMMIVVIMAMVLLAAAAYAVTVPTFITYQGKIINQSSGNPIVNASIRINITEMGSLGTVVWNSSFYNITDANGVFDLVLGARLGDNLNLVAGKNYQMVVCVDIDDSGFANCDSIYGDNSTGGQAIVVNSGAPQNAAELMMSDYTETVEDRINNFVLKTGDNITGSLNVSGAVNASLFCVGGVCIDDWGDVNGTGGGDSLWVNVSGNATYTAGNVGIGTTNAVAPLTVQGESFFNYSHSTSLQFSEFYSGTAYYPMIIPIDSADSSTLGLNGSLSILNSKPTLYFADISSNNLTYLSYDDGTFEFGPFSGVIDEYIFKVTNITGGALKIAFFINRSEVVVNQGSENTSFRVESDNSENALFVDAQTGNVGIGTTTPANDLHIGSSTKNTYTYLGLQSADSTEAGVKWYYNNDVYWLIYRDSDGTGDLKIKAKRLNVSIMTFKNETGYIGINTITPTQQLEVNGSVNATSYCIGATCVTDWNLGNNSFNETYARDIFVPYNGAWKNVDLGNNNLTTNGTVKVIAPYYDGSNNGVGTFINTHQYDDAVGVYGSAFAGDYQGFGGYFESNFTGVYGEAFGIGNMDYYGVRGLSSAANVGSNYGVLGQGQYSNKSYGVYGVAYFGNITYGVYGKAKYGAVNNYGVYADVEDGANNYAFYSPAGKSFLGGNLNVSGNITVRYGIILNGTYRDTWPEGNTSWNETYARGIFVPYNGAIDNIDLGDKNITTAGHGVFGDTSLSWAELGFGLGIDTFSAHFGNEGDTMEVFIVKNYSGQELALDVWGNSYFDGNVNVTGNITSGTGTVFIDGTNSRIGIGTSSPSAKFVVANDSGSSRFVVDTTANIVNVTIGNAAGSYWKTSFKDIGIANVPMLEANIDSYGGQGDIGAIKTGLYLVQTDNPNTLLSEPSLRFYNSSMGTNGFGVMQYNTTSLVMSFHTNVSGAMPNSSTERLTLIPSGNVGIGTAEPTQKLDVNGSVNATAYCIGATCVTDWSFVGNSSFNETYTNNLYVPYDGAWKNVNLNNMNMTNVSMMNITGDIWVAGTSHLGLVTITSDNITVNNIISKEGNITFYNNTNGKNVLITNDGKVGIGTTNPGYKLEVKSQGVGAAAIRASALSTIGDEYYPYTIGIYGIGMSTDITRNDSLVYGGYFVSQVKNGTAYAIYAAANNYGIGKAYSGYFNGNVSIMDGSLGIGTDAPTQKLDVNGSVNATQYCIGATCVSNWNLGNNSFNETYTDNIYVPYTGAVKSVDLNNMNMTNVSKMGVGTTTPNQELQVVGNANITDSVYTSKVYLNGSIALENNGTHICLGGCT